MSLLDTKNAYFDRLFSDPELKWLGQNTNHVPQRFHRIPFVPLPPM